MTEPLPIDAYQSPIAKGKGPTPKGQGPTVNAYRHGITGQIHVQTPEEQQAYDKHCTMMLEALAPANAYERLLAQSIAEDRWRLNRARSIESSIFALGLEAHDEAFAQARTWLQEARNLQLLTIYEQRIQRSVDKNMAELRTIQAQRKEQAQEAMRQAKLLYQIDEAEGIPWNPEAYFTPFLETRESVFSTPEVVRELRLAQRLSEAKIYDFGHKPPKGGRAG
jgi:hypothetical protein